MNFLVLLSYFFTVLVFVLTPSANAAMCVQYWKKQALVSYFPSLHQVQLARERISPEIKSDTRLLSINYFLGDPSTPYNQLKNRSDLDPLTKNDIEEIEHLLAKMDAKGVELTLKLEMDTSVESFKLRGAYNALALLKATQPEVFSRGIVAASSGNHAQGVARAAGLFQVPAVIVMPETTPQLKVEKTRNFGAEVVLFGQGYDQAKAKALEIAKEREMEFLHPYENPAVVTGQATVGLEISRQLPDVGAVYLPIGGGGLAAGTSSYLKAYSQHFQQPIRVVVVQSEEFPNMILALRNQSPRQPSGARTYADAAAVRDVSQPLLNVLKKTVDETYISDELSMARGIRWLHLLTGIGVEGPGAEALEAFIRDIDNLQNQKATVVLTSSNLDPAILASAQAHRVLQHNN